MLKRISLFSFARILFSVSIFYILLLAYHAYESQSFDFGVLKLILLIFSVSTFSYIFALVFSKFRFSIIILLAVAAIVRIAWIMSVNSDVWSDFSGYYEYALDIAKGNTLRPNDLYDLFPFTAGYPFVISLWYRLTGFDVIWGKIFNVICAVITVGLSYLLCRKAFGKPQALIASFIFAVWPNNIIYSSVLATEHIFIVFVLASLYFLLTVLDKNRILSRTIYFCASGSFLAMAQFIRPVTFILFPTAAIYILFESTSNKLTESTSRFKQWRVRLLMFLTVIASYFVLFISLSIIVSNLAGVNIMTFSPGYNLLMGTNMNHGGTWNEDDAKIIDQYGRRPELVQSHSLKKGLDRIIADPLEFIKFSLTTKMKNMWSNDNYGYYWSTERIATRTCFSDYVKEHQDIVYFFCQSFYILILLFAVIGSIISFSTYCRASLLVFMLVPVGIICVHLFLEVQGRYSFPALPFIIAFSGAGMFGLYSLIHSKLTGSELLERKP